MKFFIIAVLVCVVGVSAFLLLSHAPQSTAPSSIQKSQITSSPTVTASSPSALLMFTDPSLPITWQAEKAGTETYQGKSISGKEQVGTVTNKNGYLRNVANTASLKSNDWVEDINLSADGPNGSQWGYTKSENAKKQVLIFSYTNLSFTPPPTGTTCPCEFTVKIFLSDPL